MEMGGEFHRFHYKSTRTSSGYDTIWVIISRLTKSAHSLPIKETDKSKKRARLNIKEIEARHGMPVSIFSSRDSRLMSRIWQSVQEALGTRLYMSIAYHPQMNSQAPLAEFSCNKNYHTSIKAAPLRLCMVETIDKIVEIKDRLKATQDRRKRVVLETDESH
ncbi:hypothetical protein L1987_01813 [Smallanthus sonchifolius]|uniref:Uncharacterized protein n=1 Tax=Smallanthus sonchifolius TaxID=185202 RepID=A0ACB9K603_9ASTR|nr:hypothetical protein L1987_01813 [Smallanthus sonchifolius]